MEDKREHNPNWLVYDEYANWSPEEWAKLNLEGVWESICEECKSPLRHDGKCASGCNGFISD